MKLNIEKVEAFRKSKGWRRSEMAKACGMPSSTYHYIITGRSEPRMSTITDIAAAMKVKPTKLIKEEEKL